MSTDQPPRHRPHPRAPRQRSRDFTWWDQRERDETVSCPPRPKGCGAPIGVTCRNRNGDELANFPAHLARTKRATAAEPGSADRPDQEK